MSDLWFFADTMNALIAAERRAADLERQLAHMNEVMTSHISEAAQVARREVSASRGRITPNWLRASAEVAALQRIQREGARQVIAKAEGRS
jgi:hypothetical protein